MSHTKSVRPIVAVQPSQLHDDVVSIALANGYTEADVLRYEKQLEYRKQYSQRPEVVEKRKAYAAKRYLKMKALRELLRSATK